MPDGFKACVSCRWHVNTHDGQKAGPPPSSWFYQFCSHPVASRERTFDPVMGALAYRAANSLGPILTDEPRPHCRDINTDGTCSLHSLKAKGGE